jgi:hypothetical protein
MLIDGITLAQGSAFGVRILDDERRGPTLPSVGSFGSLWELTDVDGPNIPGLYESAGNQWILRNPSYSILAYDVSGTVFGQPNPDAKIVYYVAPRTFFLNPSFAGCIARAEVEPLTSIDFNIHVENMGDVNFVGTMRFLAGNVEGTFLPQSNQPIKVSRGDVLTVTAPGFIDSQVSNISFTLCGYISA